MNFVNNVLGYFWSEESLPVLIMMICIALLLFYFRREARANLINTVGFFFACQAGLIVSGIVNVFEFSRAAPALREACVVGTGIAFIRLWGLTIFRFILPSFKLFLPRITEDIIVIIAYVAWFLVRLRYAGLDLSSILATSAMITAVVAFAMQDTLGNILGGLALQLDSSLEVGDWVKIDDVSGQVVDIRWRSTLIETRNWETVVIPNSQLMKSKFMVLGRRSNQPVQWRRWVWFNVGFATPPSQVVRLVEEALRQSEISNVAKIPQPNCLLMEMEGKGYARYAVRYWLTDLARDDPTDAQIRWHIITALQRAGIKLPVEERNVMNTKENEKHDEVLHQREVSLRIKTLHHVELFASLTGEELNALAERLRYCLFARGEVITRQGDEHSHWLYIVIEGEAEVYLEVPDGTRRTVKALGDGSFFGEMGLMTGAPRSASVIARTDVECYRLDKEVFEDILRARPSIVEEITRILVLRKVELETAMHDIDEQAIQRDSSQQHSEILSTIKRFFSLGI